MRFCIIQKGENLNKTVILLNENNLPDYYYQNYPGSTGIFCPLNLNINSADADHTDLNSPMVKTVIPPFSLLNFFLLTLPLPQNTEFWCSYSGKITHTQFCHIVLLNGYLISNIISSIFLSSNYNIAYIIYRQLTLIQQ